MNLTAHPENQTFKAHQQQPQAWSNPSTLPLLLLGTLLSLIDSLLFLLRHAHGRKNPTRACKGKLPPGPPALVFVTNFLVLRELRAPQPRHLHPPLPHRTLVFIADRRLACNPITSLGGFFLLLLSLQLPINIA